MESVTVKEIKLNIVISSQAEHCIIKGCNYLSADLPTRPYFNRISTEIGRQYRCTGVFLKMQTVSKKYGNCDVNKFEYVANKLDL